MSQYGGGSQVPTKKSPKMPPKITKNHIKITNHQKNGTFHEKIICLEYIYAYVIFCWDWGTPAILRQNPNIYGQFQDKLSFGQF